jgi:hypothetical protein
MKPTSRRRLALRKLTVTKLAAASGGFYSNDARCSYSCTSCIWVCGLEVTDYCFQLSLMDTCYYC